MCLWDCHPCSFSLHCHSHLVSTFTARLCEVEINAASASHVSGSARSWAKRWLYRFPWSRIDEDLTHTPAPKMNNHEVASKGSQIGSTTFGKNPICQCARNLSEFIAKEGPCQSCLFFETRAKCQDFVARYEDDGIDNAINRPFSCANTNSMFRQSKSIEDLEIGRHLRLLRIELADHLKWSLDAHSQIRSIKDRRHRIGKLVFKLVALGRIFTELSVPVISPEGFSLKLTSFMTTLLFVCSQPGVSGRLSLVSFFDVFYTLWFC